MRRRVWSRNLKSEEAMARIGPQRHRKQTIVFNENNSRCLRKRFVIISDENR